MTRTSSVITVTAALVVSATLQLSAGQPGRATAGLMARGGATAIAPAVHGVKTGVVTTIQGNALTSTNAALPDSPVRLRDARFGRVVGTELTDKSGLFAFKVLDPGTYVIEIVSPNNATVLAASQLISVAAGEVVSAVVKMPFHVSPFAGLVGASAPQAIAVTASAATSGVLSTMVTAKIEPVSP